MLGLIIDTSYLYASVAIMSNSIVLDSQSNTKINKQTKDLNTMIEESMKKLGLDFQMLHYVAVSTGPGRFIGLRVGISTANALHLALKTPLLGMSNFDVIGYHYQKPKLGIVLNANGQHVYFQEYQYATSISKIQVINKCQLLNIKKNIYLVGNVEQVDEQFILSMHHFAKFTYYKLSNTKNMALGYIKPQYVINNYSS